MTAMSSLYAQDMAQSQVPSVIVNEFNKQFRKATDVDWEKDGSFYNVDFELGWDIDHEVWFDAEGEIVRHEEDMVVGDLPEAVRERIETDFKGYSVDDLVRICDRSDVVYKVELQALMEQDWEVVIDEKGEVLNKIAD
ncbi:PepSY-like domain-containing protein [Echinicola marina]|nr:PepSY-like domain-containing protein [Echinicola marina]